MGAVVEGRKDNLTIEIGGINVPVLDVVEDLVAFGIPHNVPTGIQDVIIQVAGGSLTFEMAVKKLASTLPTPSPTPSGGGGEPPVVVSVPVRVSFPGGQTNTVFPFDASVFSVLKGTLDSFGNGADWVGVQSITQPVKINYPNVPDIRNPGSTDNELPLQLQLQVAFNNQAGGVIRMGSSVEPLAGTEGSRIEKNFPFAASESQGIEVQIQLNGSNPNAQIIYVLKAVP